jgi:DNA-binding SARP family transcriptional activator
MNVEPQYVRFLLKEFNSKFDLRINFFGGLQIKKKEEEEIIIKWKTQKSKSLFCFLLANRKKRFTREQLMELLWPGEDPKKSQNRLWYSFTFIRNTLNSFIRKGNQLINYINETYGINSIHKIWLDFEEFEELIKEAHRWEERGKEEVSISKYESAISLYQGDFLIDMYEEWSEERRVFYKREYLQIMNKVANFYFKKQNFEKVIEYCSQIIEVDKFYEPAYLLIIQAYIKTGNRKSALDLYRKLRELLKTELHTEPSLEIKELIHELKSNV